MKVKVDHTIDCFGLLCPMPIVETARKLKTMKKGEVLEIIADDPGVESDLPAWCKTTGNEFIGLDKRKGLYHVFVKKT